MLDKLERFFGVGVVVGIGVALLSYIWKLVVPNTTILLATFDVRSQILNPAIGNPAIALKISQMLGGINLGLPELVMVALTAGAVVTAGRIVYEVLPLGSKPWEQYFVLLMYSSIIATVFVSGIANGLQSFPINVLVLFAIYSAILSAVLVWVSQNTDFKLPALK